MAMLVQMTLLLMVAQSCVTISKEKSYAQQWKTPMVARNQPYVCKEQPITMENTAQLILSVQQTAKLMKSLALTELMQEVVKKPPFAELKEQITMGSFALEFVHQPVELTKY